MHNNFLLIFCNQNSNNLTSFGPLVANRWHVSYQHKQLKERITNKKKSSVLRYFWHEMYLQMAIFVLTVWLAHMINSRCKLVDWSSLSICSYHDRLLYLKHFINLFELLLANLLIIQTTNKCIKKLVLS